MSVSDNPYQPPAHPAEVPLLPASADLAKLKGIARTQRWVHGWALVQIGVLVVMVSGLGSALMGSLRATSFVEIVVVVTYLALLTGNVQLGNRTKGVGGAVAIGILSAIPWVTFVPGMIASFWATRMLKRAGFTVGLLGASPREIQKAIDEAASS